MKLFWRWYKMYDKVDAWWLGAAWDCNWDRIDCLPWSEWAATRVSLSVLKPFHIPLRCIAKLFSCWSQPIFD